MALPQDIQQRIRPGLAIAWWGRRALYEVVEEVSQGLYRIGVICFVAYQSQSIFGLEVGWKYYTATFLLCLMASHHAIIECFQWYHEVFVVSLDEVNGGGQIDKFWGWLSKRHVPEPITKSSPSIFYEQPWYYRIWGFVTGEQMYRVVLHTINHTFIEGRKISPRFFFAIEAIRGAKPKKQEVDEHDLVMLPEIRMARDAALINKQFAQWAARTLVVKALGAGYE